MDDIQEKLYQLDYITIAKDVYSDTRLTALDMKIYGMINVYSNNRFYFSNEHLSQIFNCHPNSITRSLIKLEKLAYIKIKRTIKTTGGLIRYVENLKKTDNPNTFPKSTVGLISKSTKSVITKSSERLITDSIKNNKLKNIYTTPQSLEKLTREEKLQLCYKHHVSISDINKTIEILIDQCEACPKKYSYSNYLKALSNWIRRGIGFGTIKTFGDLEYEYSRRTGKGWD